MGDTIYVQTNDDGHTDGEDYDHSLMLRFQPQLDGVAARLGVKKLSEFFDSTAMEEAYADELPDDVPLSAAHWSKPEEGLKSVSKIIEAIKSDAALLEDSIEEREWSILLEELQHTQDVLRNAVETDRTFRFLLVP